MVPEQDIIVAMESIASGVEVAPIATMGMSIIPAQMLYAAIAARVGIPYLDKVSETTITEMLRDLPSEVFKNQPCLPLYRRGNILGILVANPFDFDCASYIELATGFFVEMNLTIPTELRRIREMLFKSSTPTTLRQTAGKILNDFEKQIQRDEALLTLDEIKKRTESEPVVKLVNLIFNEAIVQRASDIHIEPARDNASVRFRIDGMLRAHMDLTRAMFLPVTSRIKILAELDIAEKRLPQDGRIRYTHEGTEFDFRVSTLPTHHGEKTVMRILKHDVGLLQLDNLGFTDTDKKQLEELIEKPQGMIFVVGPTGSGKSSTLFACINCIRHKAINITTIENPIEYKLDGINQVQINDKAGINFSTVLRSILRQDPDVILVGEIRDGDTAHIAMQAAQTGHLVFSTLHTNDAISAITRLRDLGIPGYMISSSLLAIVAQRLVRMLCPHCKEKIRVADEMRKKWASVISYNLPEEAFAAKGCPKCANTGYYERTGISEVAVINDQMRAQINENATEAVIRASLRKHGLKTMIENGIQKVEEGITSPDELLRVVMVENLGELDSTPRETAQ